MRICENCGRENANDVDFCACGEYLRWEPTSYQMPAVAPPAPDDPAEAPTPRPEPRTPQPPPPAARRPREAPEEHFVTAIHEAAARRRPPRPSPAREQRESWTPATPPPPPATAPYGAAAAGPSPAAAITLRLPDEAPSAGAGEFGVAVVPGDRVRITAHVRNQSTIVDNYSLVVHGFPREWYTVMPETIYLVPLGSAGAYEQEVEIHLHPPRAPEAQARRWELSVGVISRAHGTQVASAPLTLGIHPYEDYAIRVRPERASGRRSASYDVVVANNANAVALLALDANDSDGACEFTFEQDTVELGAAETRPVRLTCRPPRQIWIGRAVERRFEIACAGGEEGERLLAAKAQAVHHGGLAGLGGRMPRIPGVSGPKVNMPNVSIGAGGKLDVRMPNVRGPQFQGVNLRRPTLGLKALRTPSGAAPTAPSGPLLPTQAIFRQKPWLPWWLAIVVPLLLLLLLALFLLLPKNVKVPDVVGSRTVFGAEKKLIAAGLQRGDTQPRSVANVRPGTVLGQSPDPGASVKKGSAVSLEIAVGKNSTIVPQLAGLTLAKADRALRARHLQKGTLSVQPAPLDLKIASTIPPAGERVRTGTPIDIFYPDPDAAAAAKKGARKGAAAGAVAGAAAVVVPKIASADQQGYAKALSEAGLVPGPTERRIDAAPRGTVIGTDPAVDAKVAKNTKVTMLVSAGFPHIAYDDDRNILLADGATGKRIAPAVAKRPGVEEKDPSWSADGASIAYTADERLVSVDALKPDRPPTALRPDSERYGDPSFAPIATRSVLAVSRINGDGPNADRDLCVGRVKLGEYHPQCIADDGFSVGFAHWSPDGRTLLAFATTAQDFGIVQYTSKRAFSAGKADWGKGEFVTPRSGGRGVFDVALSPDGKRLAAIANIDSPSPQLYLTTPDDIALHRAKPLPIEACKVVWLDSRILALVKLGDDCLQPTGEIVRVGIDDPTTTKPIAAAGDNPTFQPLSAGG